MGYETMKIDKGMYHQPGGINAALESLDPSENYADTPLAGLDAYQRQLKRFNIKVAGVDSDAVEKFFQTSDSAALFPEFISRAVRTGIEESNMLKNVVAATTRVDGMAYRSIASIPTEAEKALQTVAEGAAIPETNVHTQENLVNLTKRGRMLVASYEALRYQRLDLFTVTLRQIGAYIARQQFADAVTVLLNGDGNSNAAGSVTLKTDKTLAYEDLITLWNALDPYELNSLVASPDVVAKLLMMSQFQSPETGINFAGTGKFNSPLGAQLTKSSSVPANTLIGLDKRCALEMVIAADVTVDYDRLIDRQLERAAITSIAGFAKIFPDAVKKISLA